MSEKEVKKEKEKAPVAEPKKVEAPKKDKAEVAKDVAKAKQPVIKRHRRERAVRGSRG